MWGVWGVWGVVYGGYGEHGQHNIEKDARLAAGYATLAEPPWCHHLPTSGASSWSFPRGRHGRTCAGCGRPASWTRQVHMSRALPRCRPWNICHCCARQGQRPADRRPTLQGQHYKANDHAREGNREAASTPSAVESGESLLAVPVRVWP
jgi:hypothetical protein